MSKAITSKKGACVQAKIRRALLTAPTLIRMLQSGRAVLHFGPWRHVIRAAIRMARPPEEDASVQGASIVKLDSARLVETIRADGIVMAGSLPWEMLGRIRAISDGLPPGEYGDFDEIPDVRALVQCAAIVSVVRGYLQAEPELLECNLVVAHAESPDISPRMGSQRQFHFDYAGWHSLNLFTYLTDVSEDTGANQVVIGTHRVRKAWDALRMAIPDDEIKDRFRNRIRTITGPAGTMFFEDTSAFHCRQRHTTRRVMLNILYASHRAWLSKGRLTLKYSDYVRVRDTKRDFVSDPVGSQ